MPQQRQKNVVCLGFFKEALLIVSKEVVVMIVKDHLIIFF